MIVRASPLPQLLPANPRSPQRVSSLRRMQSQLPTRPKQRALLGFPLSFQVPLPPRVLLAPVRLLHEVQKANRLASTWDSAAAPVTPNHESTNGTGKTAELPISSEAVQAVIEETVLPAAAVEAIREEAAQVAEDAALAPVHSASKEAAAEAQPPSSEATAPSMDELVAKVLAKLSPDVLQAVTREILKPVIESMVKEEMNSKKS